MESLDINDVGKNKIKINDNILSFPERYLELYFVDYLEDNNVKYNINKQKVEINCNNISANKLKDKLQEIQISNTHFQYWYNELSHLTFNSILLELDKNDIIILEDKYQDESDLINKINQLNIKFEYIFVRLNSVSPKDCPINKIKNDKNLGLNIINLIRNSKRCLDTLKIDWPHFLVIREYVNIDPQSEFRCFIYQNQLTAISQYHCYDKYNYCLSPDKVKNIIHKFYKDNYKDFIYEDCIVDIIINNNIVKIVEFNSFASGISGSSLYNWKRDKNILFNKEITFPDIRVNL